MPFNQSVKYYDELNTSRKDYDKEAEKILRLVKEQIPQGAATLLDVACGTGKHVETLRKFFHTEGMDINPEMLAIARQRNPENLFYIGDMTDFNLGKAFDVVTCLFSSIGYVKTLERLNNTVRCMTQHLSERGLLIIEPWFTPDAWHPNTVHALFVDKPELKFARINTSFVDGKVSIFDLHHLVGTPQGTEYFVEHHELGLFTIDEMQEAFQSCHLQVWYNPEGLTGRGLYIAQKLSKG